ncbi:hypothetical protein [Antarcticirhabdus aurantiaca]|uniref:Uncharacterized protein n=1 Tax=Antarcticirhabdus aurantiaca TaxID=2606717 RepID=A0ACD4NS86_9HYPH|nr:hypothetical protein [Antarcticirhabdus aurantiaca]WAJ29516.1 hypothetical protein OXU80_04580 [Jeongeuplla avenae]
MLLQETTDPIVGMFGRRIADRIARATDIRPVAEFMQIALLVDVHGLAPDTTVGELRTMAERRRHA